MGSYIINDILKYVLFKTMVFVRIEETVCKVNKLFLMLPIDAVCMDQEYDSNTVKDLVDAGEDDRPWVFYFFHSLYDDQDVIDRCKRACGLEPHCYT